MSLTPRVTVLLPFHNAANSLRQCLASILNQTLRSFELLALDDGSNDDSAQQLTAMTQHDSRVRLVRTERSGLVRTLNLGLRLARAPLVARMDADDRMCPERLERQAEYMAAHPELVAVGSRVRVFPADVIGAGFCEYMRWQDRCLTPEDMAHEIYREAPLVHPTTMLRRATILASGGYRDGPFPEDYELWLRLVHRGYALGKIDEILLEWRLHEHSHSRTDPRYSRAAFDRVRADYLAQDPRLNQGRELIFWGAGRKTRRRSDLLIARGHRPAAYVDIDPRKLGRMIDGIPVIPAEALARRERPFVLCYVTNHGAPELVAERLESMGYVRGRDYLTVG